MPNGADRIAHLRSCLGPDPSQATVTFVGGPAVDVLRFGPGPGGVYRYATAGTGGTELVLSLRARRDEVFRPLAALAASPDIEGAELGAGVAVELGTPLWDGAACTAVLLAPVRELVPDLPGVGFLAVLPMTPAEAAVKAEHGADAVHALWRSTSCDLLDPARR